MSTTRADNAIASTIVDLTRKLDSGGITQGDRDKIISHIATLRQSMNPIQQVINNYKV